MFEITHIFKPHGFLCGVITVLDSFVKGLMKKDFGFLVCLFFPPRKTIVPASLMMCMLKLLSFSSAVQMQNKLGLPCDLFQNKA